MATYKTMNDEYYAQRFAVPTTYSPDPVIQKLILQNYPLKNKSCETCFSYCNAQYPDSMQNRVSCGKTCLSHVCPLPKSG